MASFMMFMAIITVSSFCVFSYTVIRIENERTKRQWITAKQAIILQKQAVQTHYVNQGGIA